MANKELFRTTPGRLVPATDTRNEAGGRAYRLEARHALAQYAATGCLNTTFYTTAETQLEQVRELCRDVDPLFIGKTALYCREHGFMKDIPALLVAHLSLRDHRVFEAVFDRVIDSGKMLRTFVQIMRSGVVGRKSLGSLPKRLVRRWLTRRSPAAIFRASVGQAPSLADIVKMVHPKPRTEEEKAVFGYIVGRDYDREKLPTIIRDFEDFKKDKARPVPDVPFSMLTSLGLGVPEWRAIARKAPWQMTRMNLNTFARHGVFGDDDEGRRLTTMIAERLRSPEAIRRARVFPYQFMAAWATTKGLPDEVRESLQDALDTALENVPAIEGKIYVLPDVSGSMSSPVTGHRRGATTKIRCIDVAALVAAAIIRKNRDAEVLPFEHTVIERTLINRRDSVLTNAERLASIGGGGTNCSAPLALLNKRRAKGSLVIYVSDNESWVDAAVSRGTATMNEWQRFKERNPDARLVCIDIQAYATVQAIEREDILNIGGFSDQVFTLIEAFASKKLQGDHWVGEIEKMAIDLKETGEGADRDAA